MAARLTKEKDMEFLVGEMPKVLEKNTIASVLFAGQDQDVFGEEIYAQKLAPMIKDIGEHWTFLGIFPPIEWSVFFHEAEVTVLPSINSTEAYGILQVESMTCGTPVISTNLPGVRQPVLVIGMGIVVPPRNAESISASLIEIIDNPNAYGGNQPEVKNKFSTDFIAAQYEALFKQIIEH